MVCLSLHNWTSLKVLSWPPDVKSWLIWEYPDAGKDWGQEEKGMTGDEMVGWHHRLDGHGFGWTLGVGDGQGGLAYCDSWGRKESDATELNWTEGSDGKESACNVGDLGLIPGLGRSPGVGHGNSLQYSCLDRGVWGLQSMVSQSQTWLSN